MQTLDVGHIAWPDRHSQVYLITELLRGGALLEALLVLEKVLRSPSRGIVYQRLLAVPGIAGGQRAATPATVENAVQLSKMQWCHPLLPHKRVQGHYSEADARTVFRQLILAIQYLHSQGVVHR